MFDDVDTAMLEFLSGLGYIEEQPNTPILHPTNPDTPKLFRKARVGMPDLIPDWPGPGVIIDLVVTDELSLNYGRNIADSRVPLLITVITQGLKSRTAIQCKKLTWLTLKAINHNRTLGLDNVILSLPNKGNGAIRWGIMPQNRLSWNTKNQPKMCYSGQLTWWVEQTDNLSVLETEP